MLTLTKKTILKGFKTCSIVSFALLFLFLYDNILNENSIKISNEGDIKSAKNFHEFLLRKKIKNNFCIDFEKTSFLNGSMIYYSYAMIMGAFINMKKIMKFGLM